MLIDDETLTDTNLTPEALSKLGAIKVEFYRTQQVLRDIPYVSGTMLNVKNSVPEKAKVKTLS